MSSFFTAPASQRKRKRPDTNSNTTSKRRTFSATAPKPAQKQNRGTRDESISAGESDESDGDIRAADDYESEAEESSGAEDETADERRLRLAQRYLDNIKEEVNQDPYAFDAADVDRDLIAERLREDVADTKGKLHRFIAQDQNWSHAGQVYFTADQNGVTAVAIVTPFAFTASSDGSIAKWELASPIDEAEKDDRPRNIAPRRRPKFLRRFKPPRSPKRDYQGHTSSILCMAVSSSGKFLATGGLDRKIVIWDPVKLKPLKAFSHHRDSVLGLTFRRNTHTLYSASADRTCKVWSVDDMAYVQTLFGHQDHVVDIGGLASEKFVSVGARDRTARLFKVIEEQQLVFRGGGGGGGASSKLGRLLNGNGINGKEEPKCEEGSMDRIAVIDEETFVTASDNGSLSLWSVLRKKPVFTIPLAHGLDTRPTQDEVDAEDKKLVHGLDSARYEKPRWITALTSVPLADVVLSGSWDGYVRVWRVTSDRKRLERVGAIGCDTQRASNGEIADYEDGINGTTNGISSHPRPIKGIINDLSIAERATKGTENICVIAAVSKSHRLGKWHANKGNGSKNGAVLFEITARITVDGNKEPSEAEWGGLLDT